MEDTIVILKKAKKEEFKATKKNITKYVKSFKSRFYKKFGYEPIVVYEDIYDRKLKNLIIRNKSTSLNLEDIEAICNQFVDLNKFPDGIKTRCRKQELARVRQIYMYFGYKLNHTLNDIAARIGYDHAMVCHSIKVINNVIETNDKKYIKLYWDIRNIIHEKTGSKNIF
jgi:chromosomal replication initiation ATPase DnaA